MGPGGSFGNSHHKSIKTENKFFTGQTFHLISWCPAEVQFLITMVTMAWCSVSMFSAADVIGDCPSPWVRSAITFSATTCCSGEVAPPSVASSATVVGAVSLVAL